MKKLLIFVLTLALSLQGIFSMEQESPLTDEEKALLEKPRVHKTEVFSKTDIRRHITFIGYDDLIIHRLTDKQAAQIELLAQNLVKQV